MHTFVVALKTFPFWAIPVAFILVEIGLFYRRRKSEATFVFLGSAGFLVVLSLIWIILRGDLNAEAWARAMQGY